MNNGKISECNEENFSFRITDDSNNQKEISEDVKKDINNIIITNIDKFDVTYDFYNENNLPIKSLIDVLNFKKEENNFISLLSVIIEHVYNSQI